MAGAGLRWLIGLAVTAALATATSADAETDRRATPDTTTSFTNAPTKPPYQRTASSRNPRRSRRPWSGDHQAYSRDIADAAAQYAVPERLIWAVIRVESGFDHRAVSRKGARGLMQLMPVTAKILGVQDAFDPRQNIDGGTRHLRAMLERFPYDLHLAIAAYNAGEKTVVAFRGVPPYPETRDYVARVLRLYAVPVDCCQSQGSGIQRIVEPDGTITYTNIAFGRVSALSRER
jgi:soluble lytic murein transglycosylase-like protein